MSIDEFQMVCCKCGSLKIKIENPTGASRSEIVYCGNCGASRGTMGALRDLATAADTRVFLLAARRKRKLPSQILEHFREIQSFGRKVRELGPFRKPTPLAHSSEVSQGIDRD